MKKQILLWVIGFIIFLPRTSFAQTPVAENTLETLIAAYQEEVSMQAHYIAYAERADAEGYPGIAGLFRATAHSEEIHARNHWQSIKSLGKNPAVTVHAFQVETTRQNLDTAIRVEHVEYEKLYPGSIHQAQDENIMNPVPSYRWAKNAEKQHHQLFREALESISDPKWTEPKTFFVCRRCSYVMDRFPGRDCPSCRQSSDFDTVT